MKHVLGLLAVGAVVLVALMWEDENGVSTMDRMTGENSSAARVQMADEVTADYADATQRRIEAEFGAEY